MCIWLISVFVQNWPFDLTPIPFSAALTCNRICWLFSSSRLLTSTIKQSFLVLPHPENDHAALITDVSKNTLPPLAAQWHPFSIKRSAPTFRYIRTPPGEEGSITAIYSTRVSAGLVPRRSAAARLTRKTLQGTSWTACEASFTPWFLTTDSHLRMSHTGMLICKDLRPPRSPHL